LSRIISGIGYVFIRYAKFDVFLTVHHELTLY